MTNFNQGDRSGRKRNFGGSRFNRGSMFPAVCSSCGKDCEVPFKPTGSKPVFCSNCFEKNGGPSPRRYEERSSGRPNFREREMFDAICDTCGSKCKLPFRPTSGKPIFCSSCFEKKDVGRNRTTESDQSQKMLEALNTKVDKILKLLTPVEAKKITSVDDIVNISLDSQVKEPDAPKKKKRVSKKVAAK